jgi:SnoaL-like domain
MAFIIVYTNKTNNMKNKFKKNAVGCLFAIALFFPTSNFTSLNNNPSNEKIVRAVYTAYEKKDWNMLTSLFAEGFTFSSPVDVPPIDIKEYKEKCWPNSANIKKFEIDKLMVDGDNVFVTYHCWTLNGKVLWNTEYFTLKDGKIKGFVCFFGPGIGFPNNKEKY